MRKTSTRWLAAACGGLLAAFATAAPAQTQTNAPVVVSPPANVATATLAGTSMAAAASPQTNVINQTAAAPAATNAFSLIESLQTDPAFQPYTNLVEHSLFMPPSEIGGVSGGAADIGPAFAGGLRVTGFFKRGDDIQASLEDRNDPDKKFFVHIGDTIADTEIKVVGFDLRGRAVLLKKGDEEGRLEYESEAMPVAASGKPSAPGMPGVPAPPGMQTMPRPGVPPTPMQPGTTSGVRSGSTPSATAAAGSDAASRQAARKQQRQQTIARLQQMLQTTTDPAAKQRLQNYIQMLEKANSQE